MAYIIYNANGSITTVPDNAIDTEFYDTTNKIGVQLVGRNAIDFGQPIAQNFLQLLENFAGPTTPGSNGATAPVGMIWFNTTDNSLNIKDTSGWTQIVTSGGTGGSGVTIPILYTTTIGSISQPVTDIYGGTFHGTATAADYADLAERYESDEPLDAGAVVAIGGDKEITATLVANDINVFGVVSTTPGLMLNSSAGSDDTHPYIALTGRVPVNIIGTVKKGDRLVSSDIKGTAKALDTSTAYSVQAIIGRALENKHTDGLGQVIAVVGVK